MELTSSQWAGAKRDQRLFAGKKTIQPQQATGQPPGSGGGPTQQDSALLAEVKVMFPWLDQVGLSPQFFQQLVAESASADEIIVKLRNQPQYKARFAGLWREDGSLRMNEAQYLDTERNYREVLRQFGYDADYKSASSLVGFFDSELDANELKDRLQTYKTIKESGSSVQDAFYVYAGMNVSTDDLYAAVVDPAAAQRLSTEYNAAVAKQTFDYETWITRATERGLQRVSETLTAAQQSGALTGAAVQAVLRTDPAFAKSVMDAIYTNAGTATTPLALSELISSFEYAAMGSAAKQAGLEMPTRERLAEIRATGIDRARVIQGYGQFGAMRGVYDAAARRTSGEGFNRDDFEASNFLGDVNEQQRLSQAVAREEAAGQRQGGFNVDQTRDGDFVQRGLR
jgi:hypothetical protein